MACRDVFWVCPTEMLLTLQFKTGRQVGNVYDRPVSFQLWSVCVDVLSGGGVLVLNHDRLGSSSRQDGYSIGQDRKCDRQAIEIHNRMVSRWAEPRTGYRVGVGQQKIKHARKLQLILTDSVKIAPDP